MRTNLFSKTTILSLVFFMAAATAWSQTATISGRIVGPTGNALEGASVGLTNSAGDDWFDMTDQNGFYSFTVPAGDTYVIDPDETDNPLLGVSTFDVVLIGKHFTGELPFTSPYQIIAADADCDNSVELIDTIDRKSVV